MQKTKDINHALITKLDELSSVLSDAIGVLEDLDLLIFKLEFEEGDFFVKQCRFRLETYRNSGIITIDDEDDLLTLIDKLKEEIFEIEQNANLSLFRSKNLEVSDYLSEAKKEISRYRSLVNMSSKNFELRMEKSVKESLRYIRKKGEY